VAAPVEAQAAVRVGAPGEPWGIPMRTTTIR